MTLIQEAEYLECPPPVIAGLVEIVSTALLSAFPKVCGNEGDIESVLDVLHLLRPLKAEFYALDGVLHMSRGNWEEAIRVLREVADTAPKFAHAKALLAYSLSMKNDPEWERYASEAMELSPARDTQYLVSALKARADLVRAVDVANSGGQFVVPESVTKLTELTDHANAAPTAEQPGFRSNRTHPTADVPMYAFPRA